MPILTDEQLLALPENPGKKLFTDEELLSLPDVSLANQPLPQPNFASALPPQVPPSLPLQVGAMPSAFTAPLVKPPTEFGTGPQNMGDLIWGSDPNYWKALPSTMPTQVQPRSAPLYPQFQMPVQPPLLQDQQPMVQEDPGLLSRRLTPVQPQDPKMTVIGKNADELGAGLVDFFLGTRAGGLTMAASATEFGRLAAALYWAPKMGHETIKLAQDAAENWDKLTPAQQLDAKLKIGASATFALAATGAAVLPRVRGSYSKVAERIAEQPKTAEGAMTAVKIGEQSPPGQPVKLVSQPPIPPPVTPRKEWQVPKVEEPVVPAQPVATAPKPLEPKLTMGEFPKPPQGVEQPSVEKAIYPLSTKDGQLVDAYGRPVDKSHNLIGGEQRDTQSQGRLPGGQPPVGQELRDIQEQGSRRTPVAPDQAVPKPLSPEPTPLPKTYAEFLRQRGMANSKAARDLWMEKRPVINLPPYELAKSAKFAGTVGDFLRGYSGEFKPLADALLSFKKAEVEKVPMYELPAREMSAPAFYDVDYDFIGLKGDTTPLNKFHEVRHSYELPEWVTAWHGVMAEEFSPRRRYDNQEGLRIVRSFAEKVKDPALKKWANSYIQAVEAKNEGLLKIEGEREKHAMKNPVEYSAIGLTEKPFQNKLNVIGDKLYKESQSLWQTLKTAVKEFWQGKLPESTHSLLDSLMEAGSEIGSRERPKEYRPGEVKRKGDTFAAPGEERQQSRFEPDIETPAFLLNSSDEALNKSKDEFTQRIADSERIRKEYISTPVTKDDEARYAEYQRVSNQMVRDRAMLYYIEKEIARRGIEQQGFAEAPHEESDFDLYQRHQDKFRELRNAGKKMSDPEMQEWIRQNEEIKNRHGGMPPERAEAPSGTGENIREKIRSGDLTGLNAKVLYRNVGENDAVVEINGQRFHLSDQSVLRDFNIPTEYLREDRVLRRLNTGAKVSEYLQSLPKLSRSDFAWSQKTRPTNTLIRHLSIIEEQLDRGLDPTLILDTFKKNTAGLPESIRNKRVIAEAKDIPSLYQALGVTSEELRKQPNFGRKVDFQMPPERAEAPTPPRERSPEDKQDLIRRFHESAKEVQSRTTYGMREEVAKQKGYLAYWSNAQAAWVTGPGALRQKGEVMKLDANVVFLPAKSLKDAELFTKHLPQLPLFAGSFEQRAEGSQLKRIAAALDPNSEDYKNLASVFGEDALKMPTPDVQGAVEKFMDAIDYGVKPSGRVEAPQNILFGRDQPWDEPKEPDLRHNEAFWKQQFREARDSRLKATLDSLALRAEEERQKFGKPERATQHLLDLAQEELDRREGGEQSFAEAPRDETKWPEWSKMTPEAFEQFTDPAHLPHEQWSKLFSDSPEFREKVFEQGEKILRETAIGPTAPKPPERLFKRGQAEAPEEREAERLDRELERWRDEGSFMSKLGPESKEIELEVNKQQMMALLGPSMYEKPIVEVATKELLQNAFDTARVVQEKTGKTQTIEITTDRSKRLLTVEDHGRGMTPEIVQKAFFTLGGSYKEGSLENTSGGLGVAKMAFLLGSKRVMLESVRDGVLTKVEVTSEQIRNSRFPITTERTTRPNGSKVTVEIPEFYLDRNGERRNIDFPYDTPDFLDRPLIGDVIVKFNGKELPIGKNLTGWQKDNVFKFDWGTADLYVDPVKREYPNISIMSAGLHQFDVYSGSIYKDEPLPHNLLIDVRPKVKTTDPAYPFNNQRENWRGTIQEDVQAMYKFLDSMSSEQRVLNAKETFSQLKKLPKFDPTKQLFSEEEIAKWQAEARDRLMRQASMGRREPKKVSSVNFTGRDVEITYRDGTTERQAKNEYVKKSFKATREIDWDKMDMDVSQMNPTEPNFHNNTNVEYDDIPGAVQYFSSIGNTLVKFIREWGEKMEGDYAELTDESPNGWFAGVSMDKGYRGLNMIKPMKAIWNNPGLMSSTALKSPRAAAAETLHTFIHEVTHVSARNEGSGFTAELADNYARIRENDFPIELYERTIEKIYEQYWQTAQDVANRLQDYNTKNSGASFKSAASSYLERSRSQGGVEGAPGEHVPPDVGVQEPGRGGIRGTPKANRDSIGEILGGREEPSGRAYAPGGDQPLEGEPPLTRRDLAGDSPEAREIRHKARDLAMALGFGRDLKLYDLSYIESRKTDVERILSDWSDGTMSTEAARSQLAEIDKVLLEHVKKFRAERGRAEAPPTPGSSSRAMDLLTWGKEQALGSFNSIIGRSLPRHLVADENVTNRAARYAATRYAARPMGRSAATQVLGEHWANPEFDQALGAVVVQDRGMAQRDVLNDKIAHATDPAEVAKLQAQLAKIKDVWTMPGSPIPNEATYRRVLADPEIQAAIERHKNSSQPRLQLMHQALGGELAPVGKETGVFANLLANFLDDEGNIVVPTRGVGRGAAETRQFMKRSRTNMPYKAAGETYDFSFRNMIETAFQKNYEAYNLKKLYQAYINSGLGKTEPFYEGQKPVRIQHPRIEKGMPRDIFVKPSLEGEVRQLISEERSYERGAWKTLWDVLTTTQLASPVDVTLHLGNMFGAIAGSQGGRSALRDLARKVPVVREIDAVSRIVSSSMKVWADSPEMQQVWANIQKIGAGRGEQFNRHDLIGRYLPTAKIIHALDKVGRVALNDMFDNMVERGLYRESEAGRRDFINQLLQYNSKMMSRWMQTGRETGLAPFVVAGMGFNKLAVRRGLILTNHVQAASPSAYLKAVATDFAGFFLTAGLLTAAWNVAMTGRPGGRPGVKVGSMDLGTDDDKGRPIVFDVWKIPFFRRALRAMGLASIERAQEADLPPKRFAKEVVDEVAQEWLHPWLGPAVRSSWTALKGTDLPSTRLVSRNPEDPVENFKAAARQINPYVHDVLFGGETKPGEEEPKGVTGQAVKRVKGFGERLGKQIGQAVGFTSAPYSPLKAREQEATEKVTGGRTPYESLRIPERHQVEKKLDTQKTEHPMDEIARRSAAVRAYWNAKELEDEFHSRLSKDNTKWVEREHLRLPSFKETLTKGGEQIHLTKGERTWLLDKMVELADDKLSWLRTSEQVGWKNLTAAQKQKRVESVLMAVHRQAKGQLTKAINEGKISETAPTKKRFSILERWHEPVSP